MRTVRGVQLWDGSEAECKSNGAGTYARIPNSDLKRTILDLFQEHGLRPRPTEGCVRRRSAREARVFGRVPLIHDDKESADDCTSGSIGV